MTEMPYQDARWQAIRAGFAELPAVGKALADLCRAFRTPPPKPAAVVLPGQHGTEER